MVMGSYRMRGLGVECNGCRSIIIRRVLGTMVPAEMVRIAYPDTVAQERREWLGLS